MKAMGHEVDGKHKQGQPRMKWRKQVEESMRRIGLRKEDNHTLNDINIKQLRF